ncbi:lantibiotic dehydratase [Labedaea rhizosphaerae]|uniref:Lantibiotic biosynthesis dehydratase-like protein n=1 Tax=Labedaea rhizosphaerae TaxID=598644 RepID=A0A4R6SBU1_LABRH|nr:lantibiotic dehydratase [Labedaea rhizosphaerae]TDP96486.1 lantibiotic biosynthesis dehydratase-like protein [Labedaea rhizosphaerae]
MTTVEARPEVDWSAFGPDQPLGDTDYRLFSIGLLRSAGFSASILDRFSAQELAAAVGTQVFTAAYDAAEARESRLLAELAGDEQVRTAIAWQNRTVFDVLDKLDPGYRSKPQKRRDREKALAMYLQRYCSKAETIGSFGPAAWFSIGTGDAPMTIDYGPALVEARKIYFERWAIAELGNWMAVQDGARWWFPPVLRPDVHLDGERLLVPGRGPVRLTPVEARVLALADGNRHADDIAAAIADHIAEPDAAAVVRKVLTKLTRQRLVTWDANIPVNDRAAEVLRRRVDAIGDPDLFFRFDAILVELDAHKARIAEASTSDKLVAALAELDDWFSATTGTQATHSGGKSYAGRTLAYFDATRDVRIDLGSAFFDRFAQPLAVVAAAADWFGNRLADLVEQATAELVRAAAARTKGQVTLADIWTGVLALFWGDDPRPVTTAIAELSAKWARTIGAADLPVDTTRITLDATEVAERARAEFGDRPGRWPHLAVHSPDLQLVAASTDAVNAGDYTVVLGELHACLSTLDLQFLDWTVPSGHGSLRDLVNAGIPGSRHVPLFPVGWRRNSGRFVPTSLGSAERSLGFTRAPVVDRGRVDPAVGIALTADDGQVLATTPDGVTRRLPELLAVLLSMVAADAFKIGLPGRHTPRLAIDDLVVFRESWRIPAAELELPEKPDRHRDYQCVQRWLDTAGVPARVFVKFAGEDKPAFFDLTSPTMVRCFVNLARAALRVDANTVLGLSEPLPDPRESWLSDVNGDRYVSELRLQLCRKEAS